MKCPYCGAVTPYNVNFCPGCGKNVVETVRQQANFENASQQFHAQRNSVRQSEMAELEKLIVHCSKKQYAYDEYDRVAEKLRHYERGSSSALIIWGAILFTLGMLSFILGNKMSLFVIVIPSVLMLLGGILIKINNASKCNRYEKEYKSLALELCSHFMLYQNTPVPAEYTNPRILYAVMNTIQCGRADTIRDAVNYMLNYVNSANFSRYMNDMQRYTGHINYEHGVSIIFVPSYLFA